MTEPHHTAINITDGFPDNVFADLTDRQRDVVVHLLARGSEKSYRRGFQQGESIGRRRPGDVRADLEAWRFGSTTDDSPWADAARIELATDRLFIENPALHRLGLDTPMCDAIMPSLRDDPSYEPQGKRRRTDLR